MRPFFYQTVLTCSLMFSILFADSATTKKIYQAIPTNPHPPIIDGKMDDPIWQKAPSGHEFTQMQPNENAPPTEDTFFKIVYDAKNLYVLIRARDRQAEQIVGQVTRRDEGDNSDMVAICLDTYFDQRTAFFFGVNAAGVRMDEVWSDGGTRKDDSWDPVWEAVVTVDDSGWTAEMKIPFSQLRFSNRPEQIWGLNVFRLLYRENELSAWSFIPQDASIPIPYFGELHGLKGVQPRRRIELYPYALSKMHTFLKEPSNPFAPGRIGSMSGGLDGKIGLTSNMNLDFTLNPDFGQVEADPSVVNLTAFETFYEEKRPFFIEGKNILEFPLGFGDGPFSREGLFYSRRIGRPPQYYPPTRAGEYVNQPDNTSILTALKVTGKTETGLSVGVLEAVTAAEYAEIDSAGRRRKVLVEPLTNYFLGRLQKDYDQGNFIIGGIVTAMHRRLTADHLKFLTRSAYAGGLDITKFWKNRTLIFSMKTAFSQVIGDPRAILKIQTSSAHYFQRPDASHLKLDSTATLMNGHGGALIFGKVGGGHWRIVSGTVWRSPGLELNDMGYLRKADQILQFFWIGYQWWTPVSIFRNFNINVNQWNGWDFGGEKLLSGGNINAWVQFTNLWSIGGGISLEQPALSTTELRGGPAMILPGWYNIWYRLSTDNRKKLYLSLGGSLAMGRGHPSFRKSYRLRLTWRPSSLLQIRLRPFYSYNRNDLQYITTSSFQGEPRYIFGRIEQHTLGVVLRFNLSLTPNLSIQYYGQPFVSAGKYSHLRRITQPRALRYTDRFHIFSDRELRYNSDRQRYEVDENRDGETDYAFWDPDFNFREFRSNLVIRWEYVPGSILYLVWSQDRTGILPGGRFSGADDFRGLFRVYPDNVFLLKISYWFPV